ncbi:Serine/threonine-protein kinase PK-1 [Rubripirellula tenax]|uniref:Serine/threonine-protein kinase PK-1 n=1 Tax=Rubripirellula tenax TaxID=2528015 RepID=A0A5C6F7B9_9BACT|nr:FHA domain-containing serine/threonine-protein kinase [Rubripirellula tenax]TWU56490.1 Serine/threonine-protein kinase PK-1 [Rubripirellula tenax]
MSIQLHIIAGPDAGRKYALPDNGTLVIGRGSDSDTKIRDPRLSRVHCEVQQRDGHFFLVDRGGAGGVHINGCAVENEKAMSLGTIFEIGDSHLRLESDGGLDAATMVPGKMKLPGIEQLAGKPKPTVDSSLRDLVGQTFQDRFQVDEIVSQSATSVVYRGTDLKHDRPVAIKVLRPQMATSDPQRERFTRAMQTVMPIKHPNIVRLRMAGRRGNYCWAATDWVDGCSVAALIDSIGISGMLDWKQVWRVGVDISRALEEAGQHHVVHRNVTPSNLLRRDSDKAFLLSDLIFARALETTDAAQLTRPGDVIGDLGYMAPERIFDVENVDERSDQFGLGATLYALLTGRSPYAANSLPQLIANLKGEKPTAPYTFQIGSDERFSHLVMRMIEIKPADRYPNSTAVLKELERVGRLAGMEI